MKGLERFQHAMVEAAVKHIKPLMEQHRSELAETLKNDLFDLDGPRVLKRKVGDRDQYFGKAFRGFLEISKSLDTLEDVAFYIRRFPFANTRISRERYLQYHVESYYSEIYLLRERITAYIKLLERQHKKDPRLPDIQQQCNSLTDTIAKSLEGVVDVRRRHVHEARFSDSGIERLGTIALLSSGSDDELSSTMKAYYREEHQRVKRVWAQRIGENNKAIRQLLDMLFDSIYPLAFDNATSNLRFPRGART